MKKIALLIVLLFALTKTFAQNYFVLTEFGLRPAEDSNKEFIVFDKSGSQKELFNMIKSFVYSIFVSPKDVVSEIDSSMITINGISTNDVVAKKALGYLDITMNYTITFHFKNGKIRVDNPSINKMTSESSSTLWQLTLTKNDSYDSFRDRFVIFDKDKIKAEPAKENIESFFNNFIEKAIKYNTVKNEDW
ncbi:MAG: DUF4468 domain-containing protein [Ignavibacteriales bacterium]|nr:DUF4468 domain-containing protein [Ignavibacteriales bacterium]